MRFLLASTLLVLLYSSALQAQLIAPTPVASALTVEVKAAGTMPKQPGDNIASPQPYGTHELFLISHVPTRVLSYDTRNGQITEIYGPARLPPTSPRQVRLR